MRLLGIGWPIGGGVEVGVYFVWVRVASVFFNVHKLLREVFVSLRDLEANSSLGTHIQWIERNGLTVDWSTGIAPILKICPFIQPSSIQSMQLITLRSFPAAP